MVTTFNKREILESNNYWIKENRFPKQFTVIMKGAGDYKEIKLLYYFSDKTDNRDFVQKVRSSFHTMSGDKRYKVRVGKDDYMCSILEQHEDRDNDYKWPLITDDEFDKMLAFEKAPFMTEDNLDDWLKHEKGISFSHINKPAVSKLQLGERVLGISDELEWKVYTINERILAQIKEDQKAWRIVEGNEHLIGQ